MLDCGEGSLAQLSALKVFLLITALSSMYYICMQEMLLTLANLRLNYLKRNVVVKGRMEFILPMTLPLSG